MSMTILSNTTLGLRSANHDLIDLLRLHIHREESAVFDVASRVLSDDEAGELAQRLCQTP